MHDALGVCELQAATHLAGYLEGPFQGNPVFWRIVNQPLDVVRHQRQDHVGLAVLITEVMYRQDVGVVAEPAHRLGLSGDAGPGGLVQSLGLDEREGHVPVQDAVVGQVDLLLAALAEELLDLVAAAGEGAGLVGWRTLRSQNLVWALSDILTAPFAELVAGLVGRTTILTGKLTFKGGTTPVAELGAFAIVFAAAGAAHETGLGRVWGECSSVL